ncbi:trigger factor [bacterium]|nr:trigger factor [bacterium]
MATAQLLSREENIARIKVNVSVEDVNRYFKAVYRELAGQISIPGFRKGKVPANVIRQRVGAATITEAVADELKRFVIDVGLDELNLSPRGGDPRWHTEPDPEEDHASEYEFSLPVLPEVTLPDYKQFELSVPVLAVTAEMKENFKRRLVGRFTKLTDKDTAAETGDALKVKFTSTDSETGEATPLAMDELFFRIGDEGNFPGWDEQLTGAQAGDHRDFNFTVPADFTDPRVAGKHVAVSLDVLAVHGLDEPELNAEFIKEHLNLDSMEDFDEYVETMLNRERDHQVRQAKSEMVQQRLAEGMQAEITEDMIGVELDGIIKEYDQQLRQHGSSMDKFLEEQGRTLAEYRESLTGSAVQKIKRFLIVKTVAETENIQATTEDFQRYALYLIQYEGIPPEQVQELLKKPEFIRETTFQILREKVMAHLVDSASFQEEPALDEDGETVAEPVIEASEPVAETAKPEAAEEPADS